MKSTVRFHDKCLLGINRVRHSSAGSNRFIIEVSPDFLLRSAPARRARPPLDPIYNFQFAKHATHSNRAKNEIRALIDRRAVNPKNEDKRGRRKKCEEKIQNKITSWLIEKKGQTKGMDERGKGKRKKHKTTASRWRGYRRINAFFPLCCNTVTDYEASQYL